MPTVVCCSVRTFSKVFSLAVHVVQYNVVCLLDAGPQVVGVPAPCIGVTHLLANSGGGQIREFVVTYRTNLIKNGLVTIETRFQVRLKFHGHQFLLHLLYYCLQ